MKIDPKLNRKNFLFWFKLQNSADNQEELDNVERKKLN